MDNIPNVALKTAVNAIPEMFLDMYNTCISEGTFPKRWKRQRLVLLPKGNKTPPIVHARGCVYNLPPSVWVSVFGRAKLDKKSLERQGRGFVPTS